MTPSIFRDPDLSLVEKLRHVSLSFLLLMTLVACCGFLALYSAGGGSFQPWALRQVYRFLLGLLVLLGVSLVDIQFWLRMAYPLYGVTLFLLFVVDVFGHIGMGAQRWISIGGFQLQPSEVMKITLVLALARHFHAATWEGAGRIKPLLLPALLVLAPVALVMKQPDLGTAIILLALGGVMFFLAGVRLWMFGAILGLGAASLPLAWRFMHDYQKKRVLTFIDPQSDPMGAGYHILQSKIALGSGGFFGKGFLNGTQSHLNFLPEKQTDFIFTLIAEEWGLLGCSILLFLYALVIAYCFLIGLRARNHFGRLLSLGLGTNLFFYVFINVGMVMGILPVVGVPLPLISYGGTAMLAVLWGMGYVMCVSIHRDVRLSRTGQFED
ncbi:MAG TPA: rod shape-determining protein RodA [Rhodospirillaceae bacterium]|nr:MAG: rod shape-determining protein RodA [Alphaproteobacteria bacterium GWF2_58_20]HAU29154.1 rod shape-determining protein RodA [Rhodospirillaceae bacterium]